MKQKGLSAGRLTLLALGTVIGGSFFLGSSVAINAAGPSVLIAFVFGGVIVYFTLYALSEMTVANPVSGSFSTFAASAFGEGAGFVVGWVYWTGSVLAMSSEAIAISILIRTWIPGLPVALLGGAIIAAVTGLNLLGADKLSKLNNGLVAIKLLAIISFLFIAVLLITGLYPGKPAVGYGALDIEPFMPRGFGGLAGSMLIVMISYAGFEIIGLAASETENPKVTIPKAIRYTVISLVGLYIAYAALLLPLIPTSALNESVSPIVAALSGYGITWAGTAISIIMVSAVFSTMLVSMFGLGRMMRSLTDERLAPHWLLDRGNVPHKGILFSGLFMLLALGFGLLFPRVYLFLISSAGFSMLFCYAAIVATHIRFRAKNGCPGGKCQLWGFPYTSCLILVSLLGVIASMPFVKGQSSGLSAGIVIVAFFSLSYLLVRLYRSGRSAGYNIRKTRAGFSAEFSKELTDASKNEENK